MPCGVQRVCPKPSAVVASEQRRSISPLTRLLSGLMHRERAIRSASFRLRSFLHRTAQEGLDHVAAHAGTFRQSVRQPGPRRPAAMPAGAREERSERDRAPPGGGDAGSETEQPLAALLRHTALAERRVLARVCLGPLHTPQIFQRSSQPIRARDVPSVDASKLQRDWSKRLGQAPRRVQHGST
jgi:hypothetical protein